MRKLLVATALCALVTAAACGGDGDSGDSADSGEVSVVASFYPLAEAAQRIGGDRVSVSNLTAAGREPHDLELTSKQLDRVEDAALVVYLGGGFQPALEKSVGRAKGAAVDLLSPDLGLIGGHHDEEDDKEGTDPHVWLDPVLMRRLAEGVQRALVEADPGSRATYEANGQAYFQELDALNSGFQQGLAQCDRRVIVTSHSAFGYLARRYGLSQEPIAGLSPESEPDPKRLSQLTTKVRSEGITTIFYETLVSPRVAQTLAREAHVKAAVLNPIEGLTEDEQKRGATYASLMRGNLNALRAALGCR